MEAGTLFMLKKNPNIYRVIANPSQLCTACYACGKESLCKKMPFCSEKHPVCFERLSSYEARRVKKEKQLIEYFEN